MTFKIIIVKVKLNIHVSLWQDDRVIFFTLLGHGLIFNIFGMTYSQLQMVKQCYAEKQALGEVSAELLETQVNPAVWEISGHMVLKRKKDYDEASEANAWRLLAEVSLSEARFQEVTTLVFETIASVEMNVKPQCLEEVDAVSPSNKPTMVAGSHECLVLQ